MGQMTLLGLPQKIPEQWTELPTEVGAAVRPGVKPWLRVTGFSRMTPCWACGFLINTVTTEPCPSELPW